MGRIKGIDHWVITAGDVERTLDFYSKLGFPVVWEPTPNGGKRPTIRIGEDQKLNVHPPAIAANPKGLVAAHPSIGGADFCLEWEGTAEEVLALLKKNGITPEEGPGTRSGARGPSTSIYFRDPDRNLVEFTIYPK